MSKKKTEKSELDMAGLLSLKSFERPGAERLEKNIQSTMQAVRAASKRPTLHFFPDKSLTWMFAQPRYGIAALFVLFLGLHLLQRPMPTERVRPATIETQTANADIANVVATNVPPPVAGPSVRLNYSSLVKPVSFTD